jgi:hypothetical protein
MPRMTFSYPDGVAVVEVIPESSKLNVNGAKPEELFRLMLALGANEARARLLAEAIVDWRSAGTTSDGTGPFDAIYRASSFLAPHASFKQLEELLLVRGMTTELFYGHFGPNATGDMVYYPALRDCVTTYSNGMAMFDINSVPGPVLEAVGWPVPAVRSLELIRSHRAFQTMNEVADVVPVELLARVGLGGGNVMTLRATGALRTADGRPAGLKRTVSAVVKTGNTPGVVSTDPRQWVVLRWYDNEASAVLPQAQWIGGAGAPVPAPGTVEKAALPEAGDKEEPVKVYRPEGTPAPNKSPAAGSTGEEKDQPVKVYRPGDSAASNSADPSGTKQTREVLKVYHVSGSGRGEASPKQP